jgi:transposase
MLLEFSEALERKPVNPADLPPHLEPEEELRRVKRRRGRRHLANFDHLPVTTRVYELSAGQRACPGCGVERKEAGAEESWQIEYLPGRFERIQHVRKKYACPGCESSGEHPQMETAAKPESAIDKGLAGPGLLSYIVTSKFNDYLPLYRLEDIFSRQGFEISRATQSVWCGDVADLVEPLYELMAERVRASHVVATDDTILLRGEVPLRRSQLLCSVRQRRHCWSTIEKTHDLALHCRTAHNPKLDIIAAMERFP